MMFRNMNSPASTTLDSQQVGIERTDRGAPLYCHLRGVLTGTDVQFLIDECKTHVNTADISCYVSINNLKSETHKKIKSALEQTLGEPLYYLNDFYMYTDESFSAPWHMDTELFTFERAVNAWVLLSPANIDDPLVFLDGMNGPHQHYFHSVKIEDEQCTFGNYHSGDLKVVSLTEVERDKVHTPRIEVGDILAFDPMRFHRTNGTRPKHAIAIKFVMKGPKGFLSECPVNPRFWPEVEIFNTLVTNSKAWDEVVDGIRRALQVEPSKTHLNAGFDPNALGLYKRALASL